MSRDRHQLLQILCYLAAAGVAWGAYLFFGAGVAMAGVCIVTGALLRFVLGAIRPDDEGNEG